MPQTIKMIAYLALAGALGTLARFSLQTLMQPPGATFPWGTLSANLAGSFAVGLLMRYLLVSGAGTPELRAALVIGFCGAFTTMSSFSWETVALFNDHQYGRAGIYAFGTLSGSLAATVAGLAAATRLLAA
jgi:CrcB protein